jgi:DNA-binding transcriptional regulator YhcF (GntR family)
MANISVQQVRDLIIDRLVSGLYPHSSKLPTARELAKEIGAHRNTVAKAYQALAEMGLVTLRQGRGTYVTGHVDESSHSTLQEQIRSAVSDLTNSARRLGIAREQLQRILMEELDEQYSAHSLRAGFVECNTDDTEAAVGEIEVLTGYHLEPLLLKALLDAPEPICQRYDVIFTSLYHIKEVSTIVHEAMPGLQVIGIYTQPDEMALAQVAQIPAGAKIGIVVSNDDGGRRFEAQIRTVAAVQVEARYVLPKDDEIRQLAEQVDYLVCSRSRAQQIQALALSTPVIVMPFHVSQQSVSRVVEILTEPAEVLAG